MLHRVDLLFDPGFVQEFPFSFIPPIESYIKVHSRVQPYHPHTYLYMCVYGHIYSSNPHLVDIVALQGPGPLHLMDAREFLKMVL